MSIRRPNTPSPPGGRVSVDTTPALEPSQFGKGLVYRLRVPCVHGALHFHKISRGVKRIAYLVSSSTREVKEGNE